VLEKREGRQFSKHGLLGMVLETKKGGKKGSDQTAAADSSAFSPWMLATESECSLLLGRISKKRLQCG